jgi:methylamine---glutamate N-methyltransferase subunit B
VQAVQSPPAQLVDLTAVPLREVNAALHEQHLTPSIRHWRIVNPLGQHAIACGLDADIDVEIDGHVGYYCAGMNKRATVRISGNAGVGLAENMMSGTVIVRGDASQSAGATGHGGLLLIAGNASARCGISMKGIDIVVGGNVGHMSAFMAQAGNLVVLGNAGEALGDSLYEARLFVRGTVKSLGADCIQKPMTPRYLTLLSDLLERGGFGNVDPAPFRRYGSARRLYNFHADNVEAY